MREIYIFDNNNVRNITIYIDEIYNGTKYNDTCITAIIPHIGKNGNGTNWT